MATAGGYFDHDSGRLVGEAEECFQCGAFLDERGDCPDCGA